MEKVERNLKELEDEDCSLDKEAVKNTKNCLKYLSKCKAELEKLVYRSLIKFYNDDDYYNIMKIDEIINNEKSHLVAEFKDFLVYGDTAEFILKSVEATSATDRNYGVDYEKILAERGLI